ncbi:reverse transcriptase domain-containing protein [Tanacetum coccineum]
MPPRRNRPLTEAYEQEFEQRVMARMEERLDEFVDQLADRMNDMMNLRRRRDRNNRGSEGEESENPFCEGDGSSSDEQPDRPRRNQREDNRRWESGMRVNIPEFDGNTLNPEGFIDWLVAVEEVFEFKEVLENKRVSLIATKLRGRASAWWQQLKLTRERVRKPRGTKSVKDYTTEFYQLIARNDIQETDDQLVSRYIGGLRVQIMDSVNMFDPEDNGLADNDYEGPLVINDDQYKEEIVSGFVGKGFFDNYPNVQEDENNVSFSGVVWGVEEESMPFYDTNIEDLIEEEEGFVGKGGFGGKEDNIEDVIVVANGLCSLMIQTTLNADFKEDINTKSHELMSFRKSIIIKLDINNAFLYGDLVEDVYMSLPDGLQESRIKKLTSVLLENDFKQSKSDFSLFIKDKDGVFIVLLIYVDDIVITGIKVLESNGNLYLSQRKYCLELSTDFGMMACKPYGTPIESKESHLKLAFRVFRSLRNAPEKGISFCKHDDMNLSVFVDSDWAKCNTTKKSITGYVVFIGTNLISWKKLNIETSLPVLLHCDNSSTIQIAANLVFHARTKHFERKLYFLREKVSAVGLRGNIKNSKPTSVLGTKGAKHSQGLKLAVLEV